jgi:hypothetical protein
MTVANVWATNDVITAAKLNQAVDASGNYVGNITVDTISEKTGAAGVTIDSVLCKDGSVAASVGSKVRVDGQKPASTGSTSGYFHVKLVTINGDGGTNTPAQYAIDRFGQDAVCIAAFDSAGHTVSVSSNMANSNTGTFVCLVAEAA